MNDRFDTPVLVIIFKRPETTREVFAKIRELRPLRLFVSANAPRPGNEAEAAACENVRQIFADIDWPCELVTNFRTEHFSARKSISSGIDWFFEQVEEGIILEDDCVPTQSFFYFCKTLLARYREDKRIMHIGGTNFQRGKRRGNADYYFSIYSHVWGWATWRRAWKKYDIQMEGYDKAGADKLIKSIRGNPHFRFYWGDIFLRVHAGKIDTWDYQWMYAIWRNSGLSIIPQVNMVSNIGFGPAATNTQNTNWEANMPAHELVITAHPQLIEPDAEADDYTSSSSYSIRMGLFGCAIWQIRNFIRLRTRIRKLISLFRAGQ